MKRPESFSAKLPSPIHKYFNKSSNSQWLWQTTSIHNKYLNILDAHVSIVVDIWFILTSLNVFDLNFTRGKQVYSRNGSIANSDETFAGLNVDSGEVVEVIEEGSVRGSHGEFNLGQFWEDTEESHVG